MNFTRQEHTRTLRVTALGPVAALQVPKWRKLTLPSFKTKYAKDWTYSARSKTPDTMELTITAPG